VRALVQRPEFFRVGLDARYQIDGIDQLGCKMYQVYFSTETNNSRTCYR
jgi:hypothetical protein